MNCALCNGEIKTIIGDLKFSSKMLGEVSIPGIEYEICMSCGDVTTSYLEGIKANKRLREKEIEAIKSLPFNEFITLNEAASILGVTKQAFNKNSRIKRGFIYSVGKGGRRFYLKNSVLKFKENGKDGRINISKHQEKVTEVAPVIIYIPTVMEEFVEPKPWMTTDDYNLANTNIEYCH